MREQEAGPLARELAQRIEQLQAVRPALLPDGETVLEPAGETIRLARLRYGDPEQSSWQDLAELGRADGNAAEARWEELCAAARQELESGFRAAKAVEGPRARPWDRARFLALRQSLMDDWQPRPGIEQRLIDSLAQSMTQEEHWQRLVQVRLELECWRTEDDEKAGWTAPRVDEVQAVEHAMAMAERFNRQTVRTLRSLRDLRRYAGTINIEKVDQINVAGAGGQQVNVHGADELPA